MNTSTDLKKLRSHLSLFLAVFFSVFLLCTISNQVKADTMVPKEDQYIYDDADLFTSSEEEKLTKQIIQTGQEQDCTFLILTTNDSIDDSTTYIEDFYDTLYNDDILNKNAVFLLIDMDDRLVEVRAFGDCEDHLSDSDCEDIRLSITDNLSDGNYYDAVQSFITNSQEALLAPLDDSSKDSNDITYAEPIVPQKNQFIYDISGLITKNQTTKLIEQIKEVSKKQNCNFVILTTDDPLRDTTRYIHDFYNAAVTQKVISKDAMILLIDMNERIISIKSFGTCSQKLSFSLLEKIRNSVREELSNGDYYKGTVEFLNQSDRYLTFAYADNLFFKPWFLMLIALGVGGVTILVMGYQHSARITTNDHTYLDESRSGIVARHDNYVRTTVTRVRKPQENHNSSSGSFGSSGGHSVSSGGHSSSGSSGHF